MTKKIDSFFRSHIQSIYVIVIHQMVNILIYGQVQSGKTAEIMNSIQQYKPDKPKILIIQNNIIMLSQYIKSLKKCNITYCVIAPGTSFTQKYNGEQVIITIYNKYRMRSLDSFIAQEHIANYCMIMDESDQYLMSIQKCKLFKHCNDILHVTATPFVYAKRFQIDRIQVLKPSLDYIGLKQLDIQKISMPSNNGVEEITLKISEIVRDEFMTKSNGMMLINCFQEVKNMKYMAGKLSQQYNETPIVIFSSYAYVFLKGKIHVYVVRQFQEFINLMNCCPHVIYIAGRLSNRGINYTNATYTRYISHQISVANGNFTGFMQKCRICGIRKSREINDPAPKLYCVVKKAEHETFIEKLMDKLDTIVNEVEKSDISLSELPKKRLIEMCKEEKIKKYSHLKKADLVTLLSTRVKGRKWNRMFPLLAHYRPHNIFQWIPMDVVRVIRSFL
jgi:hypothetical protein